MTLCAIARDLQTADDIFPDFIPSLTGSSPIGELFRVSTVSAYGSFTVVCGRLDIEVEWIFNGVDLYPNFV